MDRPLRLLGIAMVLIVLTGWWIAPQICGQIPLPKINKNPAKQPSGSPGRPDFSNLVSLPTDRDLERKLEAIRDYIQTGDFREVTQALQFILDQPQDCFVPVTRPQGMAWVSARAESKRLLGTLPPDGRAVYEVLSGGRAGTLLREAREGGDPERLAEVVRRYFHTRAGMEATELLGTHHLDRGRYLLAAVCFKQLLQLPALPSLTLFKAALAMRRHGDKGAEERAWHRLAKQSPGGLSLGDRRFSLDELHKSIEQLPAILPTQSTSEDWLVFRGNSSRTVAAPGLPDFTKVKSTWQASTASETSTRSWLDSAARQIEARGQAVLPGFFPLAHSGKAIFRSHWGLQAVDLETGALQWKSQLNGGFDSPFQLASPPKNIHAQLSGWVSALMQVGPNVLVENTAQGTLSSDGTRVFAVEDLAIPPYVFNPYYGNVVIIGGRFPGNEVKSGEFRQNQLLSIELDSGRVAWAVGLQNSGPFHEAVFVGPPLPVGGKLYALAEKEQELRLFCLDPSDGRLLWSQPLAQHKKNIHQEIGRRTWAGALAHSEGVLVCPTNSGAVVAVDLLTRGLLWAHAYAQAPAAPAPKKVMVGGRVRVMPLRTPYVPRLSANAKNSAPMIVHGKVLVTAPDANEIHCLSLSDGSLLWRAPWTADDQYLADACQDLVLIVGKQSFRALELKTGKPLWSTPTGMPSGQGILAGSRYFLPVRAPQGGGAPVILALNVQTGQVSQRIALPRNEPAGNLVIHRGRILSQDSMGISVLAPVSEENR